MSNKEQKIGRHPDRHRAGAVGGGKLYPGAADRRGRPDGAVLLGFGKYPLGLPVHFHYAALPHRLPETAQGPAEGRLGLGGV